MWNHIPLEFIFIILILLLISIFFVVKIILRYKKKSNVILAKIEKIDPIFIRNHIHPEPYLGIQYEYTIKKKNYNGYCKIPFEHIQDILDNAEMYLDKELDLPVLFLQNEFYIGSEAIEHKLTSLLPYIPIRYLTSDPARNFIIPLNNKYEFFTKNIKKTP